MTNKPLVAFGDSITTGVGASPASNSYLNKLMAALGVTATLVATSGDYSEDQSLRCYNVVPNPDKDTTVMLGANDVNFYGSSDVKRADSLKFLRNIVVWNACPSKIIARNMTATGSWANTPVNSIGRKSTTLNSTLTGVVSGTAIYASFIIQNVAASEGLFDITVDGTLMASVQIDGTQIGNTQNGANYAPACVRVGGLAAGPHTVVITIKNTKTTHFDYIAGSEQPSRPRIFVADVLPRFPANANVETYNADYAAMLSELASDGHAVTAVQFPDFDPSTDLNDGLHPNNAGHAKVAADFQAAILGMALPPPEHTFAAVATYVRDDGLYFIGEGAARKQMQVI